MIHLQMLQLIDGRPNVTEYKINLHYLIWSGSLEKDKQAFPHISPNYSSFTFLTEAFNVSKCQLLW